jgi:hypothetical protein
MREVDAFTEFVDLLIRKRIASLFRDAQYGPVAIGNMSCVLLPKPQGCENASVLAFGK